MANLSKFHVVFSSVTVDYERGVAGAKGCGNEGFYGGL